MDVDLLKIEGTSSRQTTIKYWNKWHSSLKQNKECLKDNIFSNKQVNFTKANVVKNAPRVSLNLVDLNKDTLLNTEINMLHKYWLMWKALVKANGTSKKLSNKCKRTSSNECDKDENASKWSFNTVLKKEFLKENEQDLVHKCWNLWRSSHTTLETSIDNKTIDINVEMDKEKDITMESIILFGAHSTNSQNYNRHVLYYYWDVWRENTKSNISIMPLNKIDIFLDAVQAEKNKKVRKLKNKFSLVTADKENNKIRKNNYISPSKRNDNVKRNSSNEILDPKKHSKISFQKQGNGNHMIRSLSEKNLSISSLKNEAKMSLKRAHSLLESTIADSFRGNCSRRKNFSHHIRKGSPIPIEMPDSDILESMKVREMERVKRWQLSKERRQKQENEKKMKILEEEKEALRQKQLSKQLKLQEFREKKQQEIEHKKYMEEMKQRFLKQNLKAQNHHNRKLLHMGMNGFLNEIQVKVSLEVQATRHYKKTLLMRKFNEWKDIYHNNVERRLSLAVNFHHRILLKSSFHKLLKLQKEYTFNIQAAIDFCDMRIQETIFLAWYKYTCDVIIEENLKLELAEMLYGKNLMKRSFHCWEKLPSVLRSERAREKIKNILRRQVLEIIPDFSPEIEDD